jgi:hypothetical protein
LPSGAFEKIASVMRDGMYVGGAFELGIDSERLPFRYVEALAAIRSRLLRVPYGDQAIFMRKDYFDSVGRYKEIPLMEDIELMQRVKKAGGRICILKERVVTSARRWEKDGIIYGMIRNHILAGLFYIGVRAERLAEFYK